MKRTTPEIDWKKTILMMVVLYPLLVTLMWNYGGTEIIEALGGPDANVNIIDGAVATWFLAALAGIAKRGGFPA